MSNNKWLKITALFGITWLAISASAVHATPVSSGLPSGNYTASSTYPGTSVYNAFNGLGDWNSGIYSNGVYAGCCGQNYGWIQVDLGAAYNLDGITYIPEITVPGGGHAETREYDVYVGMTAATETLAYSITQLSYTDTAETLSFGPVTGEFVRLEVPGTFSWVGFRGVSVLTDQGASIPVPSATVFLPAALMLGFFSTRKSRTPRRQS